MKDRGFTLLEIIIAIFVLTIGIIGVFSVLPQMLSYTAFSSSQLIAAYLSQEGIEIVRNIRDTNWLTPGNSWNTGLDQGDYEADYNDPDLTSCSSPCDYNHNLRFVKLDGGFYNYDTGGDTKFKRKITITPEADYLKVSVLVEWQEKGKTRSIAVQENLYNWVTPAPAP